MKVLTSVLSVIFCAYEWPCLMYKPDRPWYLKVFYGCFHNLVPLEFGGYIQQNSKMNSSEYFQSS